MLCTCGLLSNVVLLCAWLLAWQAQGEEGGADAAGPADDGLGGATGTGSVIVGGTKKGRHGRADIWHRHNAIFVLNPSKVWPSRQAVVACRGVLKCWNACTMCYHYKPCIICAGQALIRTESYQGPSAQQRLTMVIHAEATPVKHCTPPHIRTI